MIDIYATEFETERIPLEQAGREIGKSLSTMKRWSDPKVYGEDRLEVVKVGGSLETTRQAVREFVSRQSDPPPSERTAQANAAASDRAARESIRRRHGI